jgi:hypothetical protein
MSRVRVRVDGCGLAPLRVVGFTSSRNAHAHLFKHVVRICGLARGELRTNEDPEQWDKMISNPPLSPGLEQRRREALTALADIDCGLGREGKTELEVCKSCSDQAALQRTDAEFGGLLRAYEQVAEAALDWAIENPSRHGPRLLAWRDKGLVVVQVVDSSKVKVVGVVSSGACDVSIVACYRLTGRRPLRTEWLDMARERAARKRQQTLVAVDPESDASEKRE